MTDPRRSIRFLLNSEMVELTDVPATGMLLDYLRLNKRLRGSKEGCAEGDCGACTVLVGRLKNGSLSYQTVNACICFTASLDGCHVVTVEHLRGPEGGLHPVQQALVDYHGSQCGFCTPGFVMSLYALWMAQRAPGITDVEEALQGNLCRCTGYAPIVKAGLAREDYWEGEHDLLATERAQVLKTLRGFADGRRVDIGSADNRVILPASVDDLAAVLTELPEARIVGGATDVGLWVTKFLRDVGPVVFTAQLPDFHRISEGENGLTLMGGVTYSEAMPAIDRNLHELSAFWRRIGGSQVRNAGTVGGNIANGSPIGDTPPPLIALGAEIVLRKGGERRRIRLEDFFIDYGSQDRLPGEFVESIVIPYPGEDELFAVYKLSKRRDEDISSVCGAFKVTVREGLVVAARIAFGGMAATPKRARAVEAALIGQPWAEPTIDQARAAFAVDYQPLTDMRASAKYRLLAAQNLLKRFFFDSDGDGEKLVRGAA